MWAYNYTADHLRVFTERVGSHDLILCPKGSQSWIVPEKLFWENGDGDDPDRLATGRIYSKPGAIIGLSFVYFSGTVSGIGSTEGDIESFDARDRRLTGLQVHSTKDVIKELTVCISIFLLGYIVGSNIPVVPHRTSRQRPRRWLATQLHETEKSYIHCFKRWRASSS